MTDCSRLSLKSPLVTEDFPFDELLQFFGVSDHVLIGLDLHVSLHDSQVDSRQVDLPRVLFLAVPDEREMRSQVYCRLPDAVLRTGFIMQETQL